MNKEKQKIVPALRFPDFHNDGVWEVKKLSNLGKLINGLTYSPKDVCKEGLLVLRSSNVQNGQILLDDCVFVRPDVKGANIAKVNDILICVRNGSKRLIGKNAIIPKGIPLATHGAFMTMFRANNPNFVFQLFQTESYRSQVKADLGATINSINGKNFIKYEFATPNNLKEQQKIANCLSSLDTLITSKKDKLDHLKDHKKGLLQQLFPANGETKPQFRFLEFEDDEVWEVKELSTALDVKSSQIAKNKLKLIENGFPVFGADGLIGFIDSFAQENDYIAIVKDGSGVGNLFYYEGKSSLLGTLNYLFSNNEEEYKTKWLYYLLHTISFKPFIKGSGIPHIYYKDYSKLLVLIPKNPKEQQKIANCLTSVDDLIQAQKAKIKALKTHKKGLMQQLFPNVNSI